MEIIQLSASFLVIRHGILAATLKFVFPAFSEAVRVGEDALSARAVVQSALISSSLLQPAALPAMMVAPCGRNGVIDNPKQATTRSQQAYYFE